MATGEGRPGGGGACVVELRLVEERGSGVMHVAGFTGPTALDVLGSYLPVVCGNIEIQMIVVHQDHKHVELMSVGLATWRQGPRAGEAVGLEDLRHELDGVVPDACVEVRR